MDRHDREGFRPPPRVEVLKELHRRGVVEDGSAVISVGGGRRKRRVRREIDVGVARVLPARLEGRPHVPVPEVPQAPLPRVSCACSGEAQLRESPRVLIHRLEEAWRDGAQSPVVDGTYAQRVRPKTSGAASPGQLETRSLPELQRDSARGGSASSPAGSFSGP